MNYNDWTELEPGCDVRRNPVGHTLEIAVNDEPGRMTTEIHLHPDLAIKLNEGNVSRHTFERLDSLIDAVVGKRITYKQVTA